MHETTLTQPVAGADGSFLEKAVDQLDQKADKALGIRASERVQRERVDNHFAALREVVTGNADAHAGAQPAASQAGKTGLDGVTNLLNDYYTALTVSDNALSNNSMPPVSDTAAKLKMTAGTIELTHFGPCCCSSPRRFARSQPGHRATAVASAAGSGRRYVPAYDRG